MHYTVSPSQTHLHQTLDCPYSLRNSCPAMSLPHLPSELQDLIITHLHPSAAIALRQTSRHYHTTVSLHRLAPDIVHSFLGDLDHRPPIQFEDGVKCKLFACYTCLCIKPGIQFEVLEIECAERHDRQCLGCDFKEARTISGGTYTPRCDECTGLKLINSESRAEDSSREDKGDA